MDNRTELGLEIEAGLREASAYQRGEMALETRIGSNLGSAIGQTIPEAKMLALNGRAA